MKFITILSCILFSLSFHAQTTDVFEKIEESEVPLRVKSEFNKQFDGNSDVLWKFFNNRYEGVVSAEGQKVYYRYNDLGDYVEKRILLDWDEDATETLKNSKQKTQQKYWETKEFYLRTTPKGNKSYILQLQNEDGKLSTLYFDEAGLLESKSKSGGY